MVGKCGGAVDSVSFISYCLEQAQIRLIGTCEDLTQEEVLGGSPYANNVGVILWHVTRAEDNRYPDWKTGLRSGRLA